MKGVISLDLNYHSQKVPHIILPEGDLRHKTMLPKMDVTITEREVYERLKMQHPSLLDKLKKIISSYFSHN